MRIPLLAPAVAAALLAAPLLATPPLATQAAAAPIVAWSGTSDAAFQAYLASQGVSLPLDEVAVAQARSGNNAANGDYEIGLHIPPNFTNAGPVGAAGQRSWGSQGGNNRFVAFSLSRTGTTLSFTMGGYTGSYTDADVADIDGLGLRVRADNQGNRIGTTTVRNLMLDGTALGGLSASNNGVSLAVVTGFDADFTLTGEAALDWTGGSAIPSGSRLGFQIKAIEGMAVPVPEPAAIALLGVGLAGLLLARRRRAA